MEINETAIGRIILDLPEADKAEFARLADKRHDRKMAPMLRVIVREWTAAEQAAEVAEQVSAA